MQLIDAPLITGAGRAYSDMLEAAPTDYQIETEAESCRKLVEGRDLINELDDVSDLLASLAAKRNADVLGRVVLAVFDAYADRLARVHFDADGGQSAEQAAAEVIANALTKG